MLPTQGEKPSTRTASPTGPTKRSAKRLGDDESPTVRPTKGALGSAGADVIALPESDRSASLTVRQRTILDVIRNSVATRGYPPSIREICEAAGLSSTSSVAHQLAVLEKKG